MDVQEGRRSRLTASRLTDSRRFSVVKRVQQRIERAVGVMRVFMLGWEFPPFISGGLGTACYGLTKAMSAIGTDILFVLPPPVSTPFSTHLRLASPRAGSPLESPTTAFRLDEFGRVTF